MARQEFQKMDESTVGNIKILDIVACYECDKIFDSEEYFLGHFINCKSTIRQRIPSLKIKKEYKCKTCSKVFSMKRSLKNHYREIHPQGRQCPFCEQIFKVKKSIQNLLLHIKHVHDSESQS